jgi:hypothetical protein
MNADDLQRFADDLRDHAKLDAWVDLDPHPTGMHVLRVNGVEFFFYAVGGYDGWGKCFNDQRLDKGRQPTDGPRPERPSSSAGSR